LVRRVALEAIFLSSTTVLVVEVTEVYR
jgi:hypothetical protein